MSRNELASTGELKQLMRTYFSGLTTRTRPLAWCTSVGPAELLRALGFEVYFPENHGAMLGASRQANTCMPFAHARGYSPDICSYLTSDVGSFLSGKTPLKAFGLEAVPRADVLVFNTNQCRDVRDWFEFYGRTWDVPVIGITSIRSVDTVTDTMVEEVAQQIEELVAPLEAIAGTRLDAAKLADAVGRSSEGTRLWKACLETATHKPAPMHFFDGTIQMFPAVVLRGTDTANAYYNRLLAELEERVRNNVGAVEGEQFRLFWDGMPVWGKLSALSTMFTQLHTSIVASTYCNSWIFESLDADDPFRSMARASLELFIARSEGPKENAIAAMAEQYEVDGILFHDARTCPNNSNARYGMPERLQERLGKPVLTIDGDLNDLRCYSEDQTRTNIEGFIEQLAEC